MRGLIIVSALGFLSVGGAALAKAPTGWSCADSAFEDGVCDCGCGATDADCKTSTFAGCERSACRAGQVPWEHAPASCMSSACGDGWADTASSEVCDDGEALASGGCAADCGAVNPGWICGDLAHGCEAYPVVEAEPVVEAVEPGPESGVEESPEASEVEDVQSPEVTEVTGPGPTTGAAPADEGCASGHSSLAAAFVLLAAGWLGRARRNPAA